MTHCSLLIDTDTRPLIELTLQDNQAIYLTVALDDSEVDQNQILNLRKRFESVIELNLSNLIVPSTDFTSFLSDKVLDDQFHNVKSSFLKYKGNVLGVIDIKMIQKSF